MSAVAAPPRGGETPRMPLPPESRQFLRAMVLRRDRVPSFDTYPYCIPALRELTRIDFHEHVTFLVGENGMGKSTLLEALAGLLGMNPEGGGVNFRFATAAPTESDLADCLRLVRGVRRPEDGFFLRAESYFNVATRIEELAGGRDAPDPRFLERYGVLPHTVSHGESFFALVENRFRGRGIYLLDEPEAALSPLRQLAFLGVLDRLARRMDSQLVIATHSPIVMAYPHARILHLDATGLRDMAYEDTEHFRLARDFLADHRRFVREVLG